MEAEIGSSGWVREVPGLSKPVGSGVSEEKVMSAEAKGDTPGVSTNVTIMPNYILVGECPTMPKSDALSIGLPEPEINTLSDSEEYSDSDEELVWGWVKGIQDRWIPKITRYCGNMLSTEYPHCKDSNPVWEPVYPVHGIPDKEAEAPI